MRCFILLARFRHVSSPCLITATLMFSCTLSFSSIIILAIEPPPSPPPTTGRGDVVRDSVSPPLRGDRFPSGWGFDDLSTFLSLASPGNSHLPRLSYSATMPCTIASRSLPSASECGVHTKQRVYQEIDTLRQKVAQCECSQS